MTISAYAYGLYLSWFLCFPFDGQLSITWKMDVICDDEKGKCVAKYIESGELEREGGDLRLRIVPNISAVGDTLSAHPAIGAALDGDSLSVSPAPAGGWATISFGHSKEHVSIAMKFYEWKCLPDEATAATHPATPKAHE